MRKQFSSLLLVLIFSVIFVNILRAEEDNMEEDTSQVEEVQSEEAKAPPVKDTEAPSVYFEAIAKARPNEMLTLQAHITDNKWVREAKLFYREANSNNIGPGIPFILVNQEKNLYEAQLPVQNQNIIR